MKITKICIFAYPTEGEALAVANNTVEETGIAEINIGLADKSVAWIVLRESTINAILDARDLNVSQALTAAKQEIAKL